jgi:acyl carrier protein
MHAFSRLSEVIQAELGGVVDIQPTTRAADIPAWDSGAMVNILFAVEDAFGVTFTSAEMERVGGVQDLLAILEQRVGAGASARPGG